MFETNPNAVYLERSWQGPTAIAELQTEAQWRLDDVSTTFDVWIHVLISMKIFIWTKKVHYKISSVQ